MSVGGVTHGGGHDMLVGEIDTLVGAVTCWRGMGAAVGMGATVT